MEFNVKTLLPTYRLLWGMAGESQALAVAQGLGFDSDVVQAATEIAQQAQFSSKPGKPPFPSPEPFLEPSPEGAITQYKKIQESSAGIAAKSCINTSPARFQC